MEIIDNNELIDSTAKAYGYSLEDLKMFQMKFMRCITEQNYQHLSDLLVTKFQFINKLFKIKDCDDDGYSPLHYAIYENDSMAVMMLLQNHANVNVLNHSGQTPLEYLFYITNKNSITQMSSKILKYLLVWGGRLYIVSSTKDLMSTTTTPSPSSSPSPLSSPSSSTETDNDDELLCSPIRIAIEKQLYKFVRILLRINVPHDDHNNNKEFDQLRDAKGNTIIHLIVLNCPKNIDVDTNKNLHKIFQSYVNMDLINEAGETPLELAFKLNRFDIIKILLMYDVRLRYEKPEIMNFFMTLNFVPHRIQINDLRTHFIYHLIKRHRLEFTKIQNYPNYHFAYRYFDELERMESINIGPTVVNCFDFLMDKPDQCFAYMKYIASCGRNNLSIFIKPYHLKRLFPMFYPILKLKYKSAIIHFTSFFTKKNYLLNLAPANFKMTDRTNEILMSLYSNEWEQGKIIFGN